MTVTSFLTIHETDRVLTYVEFLQKYDPEKLDEILLNTLKRRASGENRKSKRTLIKQLDSLMKQEFMSLDSLAKPEQIPNTTKSESEKETLQRAKKKWVEIFLEKKFSLEEMARLKKLFRKLIELQHSENKKIFFQKCCAFLGEIERLQKRASKKRSGIAPIQAPSLAFKKSGIRTAVPDLIGTIQRIEPAFRKSFLSDLSKNQLRNLVLVLETLDLPSREALLRNKGIQKMIHNSSKFMQAVRYGDEAGINQLLGIKKAPLETAVDIDDWSTLVFPQETTFHMIVAPCVEFKHINFALANINARAIFINCDKIREVERILRSRDSMVVTVTGVNNHKIQMKINSSGRTDILYIEQLNFSSVCQRLIKACLKKGIPLVRKN